MYTTGWSIASKTNENEIKESFILEFKWKKKNEKEREELRKKHIQWVWGWGGWFNMPSLWQVAYHINSKLNWGFLGDHEDFFSFFTLMFNEDKGFP